MNPIEVHKDIMKQTRAAWRGLTNDPFDELRYHWYGFKSFLVSLFSLVTLTLIFLFYPLAYIIAFVIRSLKK